MEVNGAYPPSSNGKSLWRYMSGDGHTATQGAWVVIEVAIVTGTGEPFKMERTTLRGYFKTHHTGMCG